jgi:hypothetical protein
MDCLSTGDCASLIRFEGDRSPHPPKSKLFADLVVPCAAVLRFVLNSAAGASAPRPFTSFILSPAAQVQKRLGFTHSNDVGPNVLYRLGFQVPSTASNHPAGKTMADSDIVLRLQLDLPRPRRFGRWPATFAPEDSAMLCLRGHTNSSTLEIFGFPYSAPSTVTVKF